MPRLANPDHEEFAQNLVLGYSPTNSWNRVTNSSGHGHGARLARNPAIVARVEEIRGKIAKSDATALRIATEALAVDKQWVIARLVENVERAMQAEKIGPHGERLTEYRYDGKVAIRALELLGKELGMFVERSESSDVQYVISDEPLTPEQWMGRRIGPGLMAAPEPRALPAPRNLLEDQHLPETEEP
jgi:phage terminase small subunit